MATHYKGIAEGHGADYAPEYTPESAPSPTLDRRRLFKIAGAAGSGLILGINLDAAAADPALSTLSAPTLSAHVRITPDGRILIYAQAQELGQGVKTSFPMIIAEELDAAWSDVAIEMAPVDAGTYGRQTSGGSNGIRKCFTQLRQAGAVARAMLVSAAAQKWKVSPSDCSTADSKVSHAASGRTLRYADLAEAAAKLPLPDPAKVPLKSVDTFKLIGTSRQDVDIERIVAGEPLYAIDVVLPGMLYAAFEKCPAVGGTVKSANLDAIRKLPGVKQAFVVKGNGDPREVASGVAIVADTTWSAFKAKGALQIAWDEATASTASWTALRRYAKANTHAKPMETIREDGDVDKALKSAAKVVEAFYELPYLAHAAMEPQNCTAWFKGDSVEIWARTQMPEEGREAVAKLLGLPKEKVFIHLVRNGGAFGRGLINDVMCEAVAISKQAGGIPVKLTWTREDDLRHDHYRNGSFHQLTAGLDANGKVVAWRDHALLQVDKDGKVGGGAAWPTDIPAMLVPNLQFTQSGSRFEMTRGSLRAPRSNALTFPVQAFVNELAIAAGRDHLEFLIDFYGEPRLLTPPVNHGMLEDPLDTGRAVGVMKLVAEKAGWGRKLPPGRGLGLAYHYSHNTHAAEIAEVSVGARNKITVHKITVAIDCGLVINPRGAEHQVVGAVIDAVSVVLRQRLDVENGRIVQGNFDGYELLQMKDAPEVEVHFVASHKHPTGLGEPALPPVAPAICNAIFAATGKRVRSLPLLQEHFTT